MKKYMMIIDKSRCTQCYNCVLSCKDEHFANDYLPITAAQQELEEKWVDLEVHERGSGSKVRVECWPELCRHCENPDCVSKGGGAVYRREDGIVIIDPEKAKGKKELLDACPFKAIAWNEELGLPQKCTMCAHLLDAGEKQPRCVEACPAAAMFFGDVNDPESEVAKLLAEHPEAEVKGGVIYINAMGRFIAASVYVSDKEEVAEDAKVVLKNGSEVVAETLTNGFGDFTFENVPCGQLQLEISKDGYETLSVSVPAEGDPCFEELTLLKA